MPGATTARLVVCAFEMPMKLFMMPHTVPNRPTNGAVAPMVASSAHAAADAAAWPPPRSARAARRPAPSGLRGSGCGDSCTSCTAARTSRATGVVAAAEPLVALRQASAPR